MMDTGNDGAGAEEAKRQGLIQVNDLNYVLEPDLSCAANKTHKKHFFQSSTYQHSQRAICILNSGADYIDTRRSFLSIDVEIDDIGKRGYFGTCGSACNLIDNITISTRSGDELCRITEFGLLQNMIVPLQYGTDWFENQGDLMGFRSYVNPAADSPTDSAGSAVSGGARITDKGKTKFIIPMYILSPFFGYGRLLPAMIMSGLRIEIEWASPKKAFIGTLTQDNYGGAMPVVGNGYDAFQSVENYTVSDPYFSLCSIQLSDSIQRALNEQSATNGLEIVYTDFERTETSYAGAAVSMNTEVRKSCSRALKAFARVRCYKPSIDEGKRDSFKAETLFPFTEYQWQLGSLYFPQQPVKHEDSLSMGREAYFHALEANDKIDGSSAPFLPLRGTRKLDDGYKVVSHMMNASKNNYDMDGLRNDPLLAASAYSIQRNAGSTYHTTPFHNTQHVNNLYDASTITSISSRTKDANKMRTDCGKPGSYLLDQHTICVNLERSSNFNLAGVPVNNSRVLALRCKLNDFSYEASQVPNTVSTHSADQMAVDRRVLSIYLKYVKLCRVFLNNVEVEQ
jgi:hypothetical protein